MRVHKRNSSLSTLGTANSGKAAGILGVTYYVSNNASAFVDNSDFLCFSAVRPGNCAGLELVVVFLRQDGGCGERVELVA
jgi:hypothetical protein